MLYSSKVCWTGPTTFKAGRANLGIKTVYSQYRGQPTAGSVWFIALTPTLTCVCKCHTNSHYQSQSLQRQHPFLHTLLTHTLHFNGHFSRWTWVSRLPLSPSQFIPGLCILLGQAQTFHVILNTIPAGLFLDTNTPHGIANKTAATLLDAFLSYFVATIIKTCSSSRHLVSILATLLLMGLLHSTLSLLQQLPRA